MNIAVFGAGYVGLVQGCGLAFTGNNVVLGDISDEVIDTLNSGKPTFYEPGLSDLLLTSIENKNIHFLNAESNEFLMALEESEVIFLAVGTPQKDDGTTDLSYIKSCLEIIKKIDPRSGKKIIATKSTVPMGTGALIEYYLKDFIECSVVSNPEFLKQGSAVDDFLYPERVVVGSNDDSVQKVFKKLYMPFLKKTKNLIFMDRVSAEMVKYAANAFLATKISFINEMSLLSEAYGANIESVRKGMTTDSRIGDKFLYPGVGYGGSCFPKDTRSLIRQGEKKNLNLKICKSVDETNEFQKMWFYRKLKSIFGESLKDKTISVWGLSFKPNTDDIREAPSIYTIHALIEAGVKTIKLHDPKAMSKTMSYFIGRTPQIKLNYYTDRYDALNNSDALLVCTEWPTFETIDIDLMAQRMRSLYILDGRLIYDPIPLKNAGFDYYGVGM